MLVILNIYLNIRSVLGVIYGYRLYIQSADDNADNSLSREELMAFLHPEEYAKMRDTVLDETMEDIDKDGDGFVNLEEYIGKLEGVV